MEAGIEPAVPSKIERIEPAVLSGNERKFFESVVKLSNLCESLSQISYYTQSHAEQKLIESLLSTINSHLHILTHTLSIFLNSMDHTQRIDHLQLTLTDVHSQLLYIHNSLWKNLSRPLYSQIIRNHIYDSLIHIDKVLSVSLNHQHKILNNFICPSKPAFPSVHQQVVTEPQQILDPYELSLTSNYYFPICPMNQMDEPEDLTQESNGNPVNTSPKPQTKARETQEDSIDVISDILIDMEADELPVQTQPEVETFQPASQVQPSYYKHRFAIYRKRSTPYVANAPSQVKLFISFAKCLKSIDPQLQILPMRNDRHIHPLSTTDQINAIDEIGISNFFKSYKRTKKTLSGDFHIGTKLTFDEVKSHKDFMTWFHMNGYNVFLNSCQTSDMVHIGFLSRVRTFTYRDDLCAHIMNSELWKGNPFHFRLYFDTFSTNAKGSMTYVLMIDVDRPSIEKGMAFFQSYFDGDQFNSPNKIAYLFLPLFRKNYSDDERLTIIKDNDHYTEGVSVVAMTGLNDLETVINLTQGTRTTIRHLLLAVPAHTSTNKLFLQVERQPSNQWLLCCFYTTDATNVSLRLGALESLLKRYVIVEDYPKLFSTADFTLRFNGQAAPIKKGRSHKIIQEAPESTMAYAKTAFKKLRTLNRKRLAEEFNASQSDPPIETQRTTVTPVEIQTIGGFLTSSNEDTPRHKSLESNLLSQNHRLTRLEECCGLLAESTKSLQNQLTTMNESMQNKMNEMASAIGCLTTSPNSRGNSKVQKHHDNPTMDLDF